MTVPFNTGPLTDLVDPREVTEFARNSKSSPTSSNLLAIIVGVIAAGLMLSVLIPMAIGFAVLLAQGDQPLLGLLPLIVIVALLAGGVIVVVVQVRRGRNIRYRLYRFAEANNMTYIDEINDPALPGIIFRQGNSRKATRLVRGSQPRFVEFGNYRYTTGSGKNQTTHNWGYVAVKLDVPLPNIVLDAVGNNALFSTNLPSNFTKEQRLGLEGDFDKHFALYCPAGYERDALYLFTPDIMARFIDNAAQLDVEIVDDWLFLYTPRAVSTLDPATWAWLFSTVGALMTKFDQWARWRDDRLVLRQVAAPGTHALPFTVPAGLLTPPPGVAPAGRRLKRRVKWVPIIFIAVLSLLLIIPRFF